jgi:hypothetical protein
LVVASVTVSGILFYSLFAAIAKNEAPTAGSSAPYQDLMLVLGVIFALAAPTVLLEATTAVWYPGTRSRMFQQGFEPVLYLSIFYLFTEFLFRRTGRGVDSIRNGGISLLCAFALVFGLEYNRAVSEQAMFERRFETGLKRILPSVDKPTHFVVKMKGINFGAWYSGTALTMPSLFVQTAYNSNAVSLDPVYKGEPKAKKPLTFGSDQQGIYSPESGGWIPYQDVILVEFDGQNVTRLTSIDRETFSGYGALYAREKPLAPGFE